MAYDEYKNSGRSGGKILYQLNKIGVPLTIVSSVIYDDGKLSYYNKPFATYEWCISDVPVFTFKGEYDMYNRTLKQPKLLDLKSLLEERENMQAALGFYAQECKHLIGSFGPAGLMVDRGCIANFCLGKEIPEANLKFTKSILETFKWAK
jgi:hypothetical protein